MASNKSATPLDKILSQYADRLKDKNEVSLASLDLMDFFAVASPQYHKPAHLAAAVPYLEAVEYSPQAFAFSAPPQHGKSTLINHFVAWMMIRHPNIRVVYACYGLKLSLFFSDQVKGILVSNGYEIDRHRNSREEWRLENGSLFKAAAPGADLTGRGADLLIIDDPYKNRITAESATVRDAIWNWITSVAFTRRSRICSTIITHTRWHSDDVIARVHEKLKWPYINLEAIDGDTGAALWPEERPLEYLKQARAEVGEFDWAALYMGNPRPRGGAVFGDPRTYGVEDHDVCELPKRFKKIVIGIDCAYSKKTHSDYSAAIVLGIDNGGTHFVLDVRRVQVESPSFAQLLKDLRRAYDDAPIYWYVGGTEKAVVDLFRDTYGVPVKAIHAREDKFQRAQAVAAAWNAGRVLVPSEDKQWSGPFISEVLSFTGLDDPHDDQVDALAAAYIPSAGRRTFRGTVNEPLMPF